MELPDFINKALAADPQVLAKNSRYSPKLTFQERCAALAAVKVLGINKRQVAMALGINPSTLNFILQPSSPHYKSVREERYQLGDDRFVKEYMTEETFNKIMSFKDHPDLALSEKAIEDKMREERTKANGPDPRASRLAGVWKIATRDFGRIDVDIQFVTEPGNDPQALVEPIPRSAGWYFQVLPSSPDWDDAHGGIWYGAEKDATTSKSCRDAIAAYLGTEVEPR